MEEPSPVMPGTSADDIEAHKEAQFATLYGMGMPIPKALTEAGYTTSSLSLGHKLLHKDHVVSIVDQTRKWAAEKLALSANALIEQLQRDRDFAYAMSNPAAAIAASSTIAKIIGAMDPTTRTPAKVIIKWAGDDDDD